jgi:WhiB family redox-sensing transcriptional regulator
MWASSPVYFRRVSGRALDSYLFRPISQFSGSFVCPGHEPHHPIKKEKTMDWRDSSACLTVDPELFFPVGNTGPAVDQIEKAKAVCARCTVTEQCLQYALETSQDSGVWGGLSEDERRALKRRAARARRAS